MNDQADNNKMTTALVLSSCEVIVDDVIEAEGFKVQAVGPSGYCCIWCRQSLDVGTKICPNCGREFLLPTPLYVEGRICKTAEQSRILSYVMRDRISERIRRPDYHKAKPGWERGNPEKPDR